MYFLFVVDVVVVVVVVNSLIFRISFVILLTIK